jgi:D-amino-acid oxidase
MDVVVVGAGVIGLTCAYALQEAGLGVEVVARDEPTASDVAGGLWFPYATGDDDRTLGWARDTRAWLEARGEPLVDVVGIGRVPLVRMPRHLAWLRSEVGPVRHAEVTSLDGLAPLVVNCTGLGAAALTGDASLMPARGQVVYLRPPAAPVPCVVDEDAPTYVLPRADAIVCGGSYQEGDWSTEIRDAESADILARCTALVPQLSGCEVLGARAGLRPIRKGGPRVARTGDVIHCYGHGGAGVTLSWGCALEVVRLARAWH